MKRWISFLVGVAGSLFFLWLGFRNLAFDDLWDVLRGVNLLWIAVAVPVYFVATYILTWRWYYLLRPVKDIHPNRLFPVVVIGYMANNLLPFRLGEVMRAYVLKRREGVPVPPILTTILIERIFDGLVMLSFIFTALVFVDLDVKALDTVIWVTAPLFFGALLIFFWLAAVPKIARRIYTRLIETLVPGRLRERLLALVDQLFGGLEALRSGRALAGVVFYSLWSWTTEASTYWLVMHAFDFRVSFFVLLLVVGFGNLSTILPSTAGYVGTFHAAAILTLTAFDIRRADAASYALVMHATLWLPITLAGLFYLLRLGFRWSDFSRAQAAVGEAEHDTDQPPIAHANRVEPEAVG